MAKKKYIVSSALNRFGGKEGTPNFHFFDVYRFAEGLDIWLLALGLIFSGLAGAIQSLNPVIYGSITVDQEEVCLLDIVDTMSNVLYYIHGYITLVALLINKSAILKIIDNMQASFWKIEKMHVNEEKQSCLLLLRLLEMKHKSYLRFFLLNILVFVLEKPLRKGRLSKDTYPVPEYLPPFVPDYCTILLHTFHSYSMFLAMFVTDSFVLTIATLMGIQFKMLNYEMMRLFSEAHLKGGGSSCLSRFKKCNEHLTYLMEFRTMFNATFSGVLLVYLGIIVLSVCTLMYCVSTPQTTEDMIRLCGHAFGMIFQFAFCYCTPVQYMMDEAEKVPDSIYLSQWQENPDSYQTVLMLIAKSQQKIYLRAGGLTEIGHQSGLSALKTVVSYWGFLRTVGSS